MQKQIRKENIQKNKINENNFRNERIFFISKIFIIFFGLYTINNIKSY